jgi:hypothetical protein
VVEQVGGMSDCHRPKGMLRDIRPVNASVDHHGLGYGHDGSDVALSHAIAANCSLLRYDITIQYNSLTYSTPLRCSAMLFGWCAWV